MTDKVYIKGFEIDMAKVAEMFGEDNVDAAIVTMVKYLDRSSYIRITTGYVPHGKSHALVIVLDMDSDEDKLKERPLRELDPTFEWMGKALNGPSIWEES